MPLTNAQLVALKNDIASDGALSGLPHTPDNANAIAILYNMNASPDFTVWKTNVVIDNIMRNGMDWTRVDNLSVGKARIWEWMTRLGTINASAANVRAGIDATWVGTQADLDVRAAVYTHCKRLASRVERLFATGTGTSNSPGTMTFEGIITLDDVQNAWNS